MYKQAPVSAPMYATPASLCPSAPPLHRDTLSIHQPSLQSSDSLSTSAVEMMKCAETGTATLPGNGALLEQCQCNDEEAANNTHNNNDADADVMDADADADAEAEIAAETYDNGISTNHCAISDDTLPDGVTNEYSSQGAAVGLVDDSPLSPPSSSSPRKRVNNELESLILVYDTFESSKKRGRSTSTAASIDLSHLLRKFAYFGKMDADTDVDVGLDADGTSSTGADIAAHLKPFDADSTHDVKGSSLSWNFGSSNRVGTGTGTGTGAARRKRNRSIQSNISQGVNKHHPNSDSEHGYDIASSSSNRKGREGRRPHAKSKQTARQSQARASRVTNKTHVNDNTTPAAQKRAPVEAMDLSLLTSTRTSSSFSSSSSYSSISDTSETTSTMKPPGVVAPASKYLSTHASASEEAHSAWISSQKPYKLSTGHLYRGEWQGKRATGFGEKLIPRKSTITKKTIYERHRGIFLDGKLCGEGEMEDDASHYKGQVYEGVENGWGVYRFKLTGDVIEGEFVNRRAVRGTLTFGNDKTVYKGTFNKACQPHGVGEFKYGPALVVANETLSYLGEVNNGEPHGRGKMVYKNDDSYEGEWKLGNVADTCDDGVITWRFPDGSLCTYRGACKKGKAGATINCQAGKLTFTGADQDGVYEGGLVDRELYTLPCGFGRRSYDNGDYYEGEYNDKGEEHGYGEWFQVHQGEKDSLHYKGYWKCGVEHGGASLSYYLDQINEFVTLQCTMDNGKSKGHSIIYINRNKHIMYDGNMTGGQYDGLGIMVHPDNWVYSGDWCLGEMKGFGKLWYSKEGSYWLGEMSWDGRHGKGKVWICDYDDDDPSNTCATSAIVQHPYGDREFPKPRDAVERLRVSWWYENICNHYLHWDDELFQQLGYGADEEDCDTEDEATSAYEDYYTDKKTATGGNGKGIRRKKRQSHRARTHSRTGRKPKNGNSSAAEHDNDMHDDATEGDDDDEGIAHRAHLARRAVEYQRRFEESCDDEDGGFYFDDFIYKSKVRPSIVLTVRPIRSTSAADAARVVTVSDESDMVELRIQCVRTWKPRLRRMNLEAAVERCYNRSICTYAATRRIGLQQVRYKCITCSDAHDSHHAASHSHHSMTRKKGVLVCKVCYASGCHEGHELSKDPTPTQDLVYCHCGAGNHCMSMPTPTSKPTSAADSSKSASREADDQQQHTLQNSNYSKNDYYHNNSYDMTAEPNSAMKATPPLYTKWQRQYGKTHDSQHPRSLPIDAWIAKHRHAMQLDS